MRRFVLTDDQSNKFWDVECSGIRLTVTFGRIGTNGQSRTKEFASGWAATDAERKLIKEKVSKGYIEVTTGTPSRTAVAAAKNRRRAAPSKETKGEDTSIGARMSALDFDD